MASRATIVLPEPTSPCTRRFMGCGDCMSSAISRSTRFWAPVRRKGRMRFTASRVAVGDLERRSPLRARLAALLRSGQAELEEEELLEDQPQVRGAAGGVEERHVVVLARDVDAAQRGARAR